MQKFKIIVLLFFFSLSIVGIASAENTNTGFVPSNIWYSKDPFSEGDKIKIYTLLFNQDEREFSGFVAFYNRDTLLGKKEFSLKSQESSVVSLDWTVTAGTNTIYAKIIDAKFSLGEGQYQEVVIAQNQSEKSQKVVIKKISKDLEKVEDTIKEKVTDILEPAKDIPETIIENTPEPILSVANKVDGLRVSGANYFIDKKEDAKNDIADYNKTQTVSQTENSEKTKEDTKKTEAETAVNNKEQTQKSSSYKPLKYLSLFFFTILSFILNNQVVFYISVALILFYIIRFLWLKFA
ncbi:MAG: hypothetical protein WC011_00585 [Candidatus Paceibacterota bacterium]